MSQLGKDLWRLFKDYLCTSDHIDHGGVDQLMVNLERIHDKVIARITTAALTSVDRGRAVNPQSTWKGSTKTCKNYLCTSDNVESWGVNRQSTWKGSAKTLQGLPLTVLIHGEGSINQSSWKGSMKTLQGLPLTVLILGWGGQLTVNLERIHKDFARITSDSVDPGGVDWQSTWKGSAKTLQGLTLHLWPCWS